MKKEILNTPQIFVASNFWLKTDDYDVNRYCDDMTKENERNNIIIMATFSSIETSASKNRKQTAMKNFMNEISQQVVTNANEDFSIQVIFIDPRRNESMIFDKQGGYTITSDDIIFSIDDNVESNTINHILVVLPFSRKELSIAILNEITDNAITIFEPDSSWQSKLPFLKDLAEQDKLIINLTAYLEINPITGPNFKFVLDISPDLIQLTNSNIRLSTLTHIIDQVAKNLMLKLSVNNK